MFRFFKRSFVGTIGAMGIVLVILIAVFAPFLAPYDPLQGSRTAILEPPSSEHWFGTDHRGRDVLSRVIWGARISLMVGMVSVVIGSVTGTLYGLIAGYSGGRIDEWMMRIVDVLLCFPTILLAILLLSFFGRDLIYVMIAIGFSRFPRFARMARASTLSLKEREFVEAARGLGSSTSYILRKHIIPNITAPLLVMASADFAVAIIVETSLSYLGFGSGPGAATWGAIIRDGRGVLREASWVALFGGLPLMVAVLSVNMFGDGLRDYLDPKI